MQQCMGFFVALPKICYNVGNTRRGCAMRLDKYLKVSRIIKRRSVAKEAGDGGRVHINRKPAKPANEVKVGDVLEIRFGDRLSRYEVLSISEHAAKADASGMYRALVEDQQE